MEAGGASSRHEARERALQITYAVEVGEHSPRTACDELLGEGVERYLIFARELVLLAVKYRDEMDERIKAKAEKWDLNRIALMDRLILRLALVELFHVSDVPPKVTINEAIELAKEFSTDQSGRFINGILDAILIENELVIRRIKKASAMKEVGPASGGAEGPSSGRNNGRNGPKRSQKDRPKPKEDSDPEQKSVTKSKLKDVKGS